MNRIKKAVMALSMIMAIVIGSVTSFAPPAHALETTNCTTVGFVKYGTPYFVQKTTCNTVNWDNMTVKTTVTTRTYRRTAVG